MKADGAVHLDYSIVCAYCGKLLRTVGGKDLEEIHTDSEGEDVCAECCDVCNYVKAHDVEWEDARAILRGELDDGAPPSNSVTCPVCNGYGLYPSYSFTEMSYEAEDCEKCGGEGWIIPE